MTMKYRTIKAAGVNILGAAEAGRFQTIGYQRKNKSGDDINQKKMVQFYYSSGGFPLSGGTQKGPKSHDMSFNTDITVAVSAEADLTVLNNDASTPAQKAAALAGVLTASEKADNEIDELIEIVFQILMDARNIWLGLPKGTFSSRYIPSIKKDQTLEEGKFAVKTAQMIYTCNADEDVPGDPGTPVEDPVYDTTVDINGDDVEQTGGTVTNTGG